jgi:hypothetical protein
VDRAGSVRGPGQVHIPRLLIPEASFGYAAPGCEECFCLRGKPGARTRHLTHHKEEILPLTFRIDWDMAALIEGSSAAHRAIVDSLAQSIHQAEPRIFVDTHPTQAGGARNSGGGPFAAMCRSRGSIRRNCRPWGRNTRRFCRTG